MNIEKTILTSLTVIILMAVPAFLYQKWYITPVRERVYQLEQKAVEEARLKTDLETETIQKDAEIERLKSKLQAKLERKEQEQLAASKHKILPQYTQYSDCEPYRSIIDDYDWDINIAMSVCDIESSGNIYAANMNDYHGWAGCYGSFGLFQLNCAYGQLYEPAQNVLTAYNKYVANGRTFCTTSGWLNTCKKLGLI